VVASLLAHQGGWDELLLVAAPVAVIALLLVLADRRAKRALDAEDGGEGRPPAGEQDETLGGPPAG
jgi:hypothetical protein